MKRKTTKSALPFIFIAIALIIALVLYHQFGLISWQKLTTIGIVALTIDVTVFVTGILVGVKI